MQRPIPPPPPPPLPPAPPPPPEGTRAVPWTGRDLAITLLAGGGLGLFLTVLFLLPLQNAGTQLRPAAVLLITSLLVYGPLCLLGWYFALKRNGASPADAGLRWVGWGPVLLMIPGAIGLIIVTGLLSALIGQLLGAVPTAQEQVIPGQSTLPTWDLVALVVAGAIAAPSAEEFLFRGLLYRYLRSRRSVQAAVLISSLVFAIAHFTPILIPVLFVFGIAEALVAERYESLYPAMALHALNNGALFVALYLTLN